jgi:hypothetical protein
LDRLLTEGGYRCPPTSQVFRRAGLGPSPIQNTIQNSALPNLALLNQGPRCARPPLRVSSLRCGPLRGGPSRTDRVTEPDS